MISAQVETVRKTKQVDGHAAAFGGPGAVDSFETEDYLKCFLLQGATYLGLDAAAPRPSAASASSLSL